MVLQEFPPGVRVASSEWAFACPIIISYQAFPGESDTRSASCVALFLATAQELNIGSLCLNFQV